MVIKQNEKLVDLFINEFASYGSNIAELEKLYSSKLETINQKVKLGEGHYDVTYVNELLDSYFTTHQEALEQVKEQNKEQEELLRKTVKNFTQEMLVAIYKRSNNKFLNEVLLDEIKENNTRIEFLNGVAMESGLIFELVEGMDEEELERTMILRENIEELKINDIVLSSLDNRILGYLQKVKAGGNLQDEKQKYCKENGIKSELEFQFNKNRIRNEYLLKEASEIQKLFNDLTGTKSDSFVESAYDQMSGIKIVTSFKGHK